MNKVDKLDNVHFPLPRDKIVLNGLLTEIRFIVVTVPNC